MYAGDARGWYVWTGAHWRCGEEAAAEVLQTAGEVLGDLMREMFDRIEAIRKETGEDPYGGMKERDYQRMKAGAIRSCGQLGTVQRALQVLAVHPDIRVDPDLLDQNDYLLSVRNGTLDLRTQKLRAHDPKDRLTTHVPFDYVPGRKATLWEQTLLEIFSGDAQLVRLVQVLFAWTLTGEGSRRAQFFVLLYGGTNSGKGLITRVIAHILGEMACPIPFACIAEAGEGTNSALAQLEGKRMAYVGDVGGSPAWDGEVLKQFTGGDTISVSEKYKPQKRYRPRASLWLSTNDLPSMRGAGKAAIFNRMLILPCLQKFSADPEEVRRGDALPLKPDLEEELKTKHAEAILAWGVAGMTEYLSTGIPIPEAVRRERKSYEEDVASTLEAFVEQNLETEFNLEDGILPPADWNESRVAVADVHLAYTAWLEAQGQKVRGTERTTSRLFNALCRNQRAFRAVEQAKANRLFGRGSGRRVRGWARLRWNERGEELLRSAGTQTWQSQSGYGGGGFHREPGDDQEEIPF